MFMGSTSTGARASSNDVRRIAAIVLTILSIAFLFWPPAFYLADRNGEFSGASFLEMQNRFTEGETSAAGRVSDGIDDGSFAMVGFVAGFYICLLLGIASVIGMLLRRSNLLAILYAGFTVLLLFCCIAYLIGVSRDGSSIEERPGAGLFLIPLFAAAAVLLYPAQRKKTETEASVPEKEQPSAPPSDSVKPPVPKTGALINTFKDKPASGSKLIVAMSSKTATKTENPPEKPAKENPQPEGEPWECPLCGRRNKSSELFCPNCNTIRE